MLRLSTTHDHQVRQADLPTEPTDLGAAPDCGIHLPFPGVSRHHARVEPVEGGVRLVDLGSKNGLRQKAR
jgi:pSer/pThr/pTyr-binding forkhead associated (FHA) protein